MWSRYETMQIKIPFSYTSSKNTTFDRNSDSLIEKLYRTNQSIQLACEELDVEFEEGMLGDLEPCTHCSVFWHSYELTPDEDGNNVCKFCETYYWK